MPEEPDEDRPNIEAFQLWIGMLVDRLDVDAAELEQIEAANPGTLTQAQKNLIRNLRGAIDAYDLDSPEVKL